MIYKNYLSDKYTLELIRDIEKYLNLENKNIDEMTYVELVDYIEQLNLMIAKYQI